MLRAIPEQPDHSESLTDFVSRKTQFLLVIVVALLVIGGVFVLTWDIPPPLTEVEKVIPDDRFPR